MPAKSLTSYLIKTISCSHIISYFRPELLQQNVCHIFKYPVIAEILRFLH